MTEEHVRRYEKVIGQLEGAFSEIAALARKKPDDGVNRFKLDLVNRILAAANDLLGEGGRPFAHFEQFDPDEVPQNSDVVFVLSQYQECLEHLRSQNIDREMGRWVWFVDDGNGRRIASSIQVPAPKSLRKK